MTRHRSRTLGVWMLIGAAVTGWASGALIFWLVDQFTFGWGGVLGGWQ